MADKDAGTPRVYLARHGETEWTKSGRYTGLTDIALTANGKAQVLSTGQALVGPHKLIDPSKLAHVFVSPRQRAQVTFELLFTGGEALRQAGKVSTTEQLAEWNYGEYEGLLTKEICARRVERGLDTVRAWDIWRDGCEGGESAEQMSQRLNDLIDEVRVLHAPNMHGEKACDVVLVAHGHVLRAFVKRWLGYPMEFPLSIMLEPGGIGILSYQHHNIKEPALLVGLAVPALEKNG